MVVVVYVAVVVHSGGVRSVRSGSGGIAGSGSSGSERNGSGGGSGSGGRSSSM